MSRAEHKSIKEQLNRLSKVLLDPHRSEAVLKGIDTAAQKPVPTIWLLGKTQAGKSSIVSALTGHPHALVGSGFSPCTRTAQSFAFPEESPLVRFLDTRGLGEAEYDPTEDMENCEKQAHLILAVCRVSDPAQDAVFDVLRKARLAHPDWGMVIAQTGLHDLYPDGEDHALPYPFLSEPDDSLAQRADLLRALHAQRANLTNLKGPPPIWVPIDFTASDDGFEPHLYGLEQLWEGIESVLPLGIAEAIRRDSSAHAEYGSATHSQVVFHALSAAGCGALPVVDIVAVTAIQAKMLHVLARQAGYEADARAIAEFLGMLGGGIAGGAALAWLRRSVVKLIPGWGQVVGAAWGAVQSGALTYALGFAAARFFKARRLGEQLEPAALRAIYQEELIAGQALVRTMVRRG